MAKRFTDSNKYKKKFYRNLPGPYKLLWDFLYHDCDNCGIWIVDFELAQAYLGKDMPVTMEKALEYFNTGEERIIQIKGGEKWFLPGYIEFQYVQLSEKNRAHIPVISALKKLDLLNPDNTLKEKIKEDISPLQGAKDKAQEKDKDKDKAKEVLVNPDSVLGVMAQEFKDKNPSYPFDQFVDAPMLRSVAEKILKWQNSEGDLSEKSNHETVRLRWGELVAHIRADSHLSKYSLTQINKHFQSVVQSFNNGNQSGSIRKDGTNRATITGKASGAGTFG